ncbi:NYN domain-containing protein [bacterium]|nr:NYN domain-containing protein [bacterium]MBU3955553.1 NYN domain-containing protein [bacterium]
MKNIEEKVYAFIDSQNLNLSIRAQGWKLDFKRLLKYLRDRYNVQKAFIFIGRVPSNEVLYAALKSYGYILIFKPTLVQPDGKVKGNIDAELVLHSMIEYPNYDKAIIASGDGDFRCLVEYLIQKNKLLKIVIPNKNSYSSLLREFMKHILFMNGLKEKLEYRGK